MKTRSRSSLSIRPTAGGIRRLASQALRSLNLALLLCLLAAPLPPAIAADVTLAWDPSPDATVVGYKLHWGGASGTYTSHLDVGNVLTATVPGLEPAVTYYFAATAYDGAGLESDYSNEVEYTPPTSNQPPTLASIANQTINEDTSTGPIALTVGDVDNDVNTLVLTATANNSTLVPASALVFGGSGANRTLTVTPAADQNGSATITVTVSDGALSANRSFTLTVNAVNDAPTLSSLEDQQTIPGGVVGPLPLTVGDIDNPAETLTLSATSSEPTIIPTANIQLGGSGTSRSVTLTAAEGQAGSSLITLTVSDGTATAQTSFLVTVTAGIPVPWGNTDIGLPALEGSASGTLIAITACGSGTGIGGSADQFHYVHQTMSADGEITVRVTQPGPDLPQAKAGIMMRETMGRTSRYYFLCVTPSGVRLQWRTTEGGKTSELDAGSLSNSGYCWLRITRSGNQFRAFRSEDGVRWSRVGTFLNQKMLTNLGIGLAVTSHDAGRLHDATFDNITVVP
ncbi:MAG: fibronectin type III domain-containing protein [Verrucomicrobiales bacterium]|nr:fibronectin type III domain-containing protein [Verrucomicrobiales bacterium]